MTPRDRHSTSLILSGAGSYSAYEVGVMAALFAGQSASTGYTPLDPDLLVGTSAGAVNIATLAAHEVRTGSLVAAVDALRTLWIERIAEGPNVCGNGVFRIRGLPNYLFDPDCLRGGLGSILLDVTEDATVFLRGSVRMAVDFFGATAPAVRTLARSINLSAVVSVEPILDTLQAILPLKELDRSTRRLRIVALDLTAGELRLFDENDVRRLGYLPLLGSAAIPVFFPPHIIEGHVFVNPTTFATTPLLPALHESDTMHLVYMDPDLRNIAPDRLVGLIDAMDRVMVVNFAYMLEQDILRAGEINRALALIEDVVTPESLTSQDIGALLRSLARIRQRLEEGRPYRPLTVHRYHPRDDLGSDLGLMNLDRGRITELIDRGYADTIAHDCAASGCLLPGRPMSPSPRGSAAAVASRTTQPSPIELFRTTPGPARAKRTIATEEP
jgi:predicted acylesterase/phospholipase RssA